MAAVSDHEGVVRGPAPVPLGSMLVARGLLSEEHLSVALAEQQQVGRPLGDVLVSRGYVPAPVIARALATQNGGVAKTEYGYAVGFDSRIVPSPFAEPPVSPTPIGSAGLRAVEAVEAKRLVAATDTRPAIELELARAQEENLELLKRLRELEEQVPRLTAERDTADRDASIAIARLSGFEAAVDSLRERLAGLEQRQMP